VPETVMTEPPGASGWLAMIGMLAEFAVRARTLVTRSDWLMVVDEIALVAGCNDWGVTTTYGCVHSLLNLNHAWVGVRCGGTMCKTYWRWTWCSGCV